MGDISYTPTFSHQDWVDEVDRVEAAGPNGFNVRFRAIDRDLHEVSTVVGQIGAELDAIVVNPPVRQQRLTLAPLLRTSAFAPGWTITTTGAAQAPAGVLPAGTLNLALPDGVRLLSLRASGQANGTTVTISLIRQAIEAIGTASETLAVLTGDTNPYDRTIAVDATSAVVDGLNFRYFISATTAAAGGSAPVTVAALHLDYLTS